MHITLSQMIVNHHDINHVSSKTAEFDSRCGVCGGEIQSGDPCDDLVFPSSFTNQRELANFSAPYRCLGCSSVMADKRFQMQLSTVVITPDSIFPFAKKIHRGYFLLNPPNPPFSMVIGVSKQQHVIWRSPVNLDNKRFQIQLGDERITIRHNFLIDAVNAVKSIHSSDLGAILEKKQIPKKTSSPFTFSNMKSARSKQSEWTNWAVKLSGSDLYANEFKVLNQLSSSEAWALDFCLSDDIEKPNSILI